MCNQKQKYIHPKIEHISHSSTIFSLELIDRKYIKDSGYNKKNRYKLKLKNKYNSPFIIKIGEDYHSQPPLIVNYTKLDKSSVS